MPANQPYNYSVILKTIFQKLFGKGPSSSEPVFPKEGILWHKWNEETEKLIQERDRPVLLFVANPDPTVSPFLKAVLGAMPSNAKLRGLLHDYYIGLMIQVDSLPELFRALGAGSRYNIAILSPAGLTPLAVIDPTGGKPGEIVETITAVLENLKKIY